MSLANQTRSWVILVAVLLVVSAAKSQPPEANKLYEEVFYPSGKRRIQAYFYKPEGKGPFPMVIYNHGSRAGRERVPAPFPYIGRMLAANGYAVLVPERRGYGLSDGPSFSEAVGEDRGGRFVTRMQEETDDVLAALEFLKTVPSADSTRIAVMGWSLGGIVSVFAASRSAAFQAVVDQAGAALTWDSSPAIQKAMKEAAAAIHVPLLAMDAANDRTTEAVKAVVQEVQRRNLPVKLIVYPPYQPPESAGRIAPGHLIFAAPGAHIWEADLKQFLAQYVRVAAHP
jgi:dienelactone hydrolase